MGCSSSVVKSFSEERDFKEPSPLANALRMKKYELMAKAKLAMTSDKDLYSDTRSVGSMDHQRRQKMNGWVMSLPPSVNAPMPEEGDSAETDVGSLDWELSDNLSEEFEPGQPFFRNSADDLPTCLYRTTSDELLETCPPPPPVRLQTDSQLAALGFLKARSPPSPDGIIRIVSVQKSV
eukprot:TRINITY_DN25342_c0_g1_i1.p1 TRINITY_DN25342_c0_g1~~TRINITY_DN25342_c0_g1_i1.p1  ORF type:complete len:179 (+),score=38.34 TRINITY_DN25342_c0_g1_i1:54-590(+)